MKKVKSININLEYLLLKVIGKWDEEKKALFDY